VQLIPRWRVLSVKEFEGPMTGRDRLDGNYARNRDHPAKFDAPLTAWIGLLCRYDAIVVHIVHILQTTSVAGWPGIAEKWAILGNDV
jgi:hypothetical protein